MLYSMRTRLNPMDESANYTDTSCCRDARQCVSTQNNTSYCEKIYFFWITSEAGNIPFDFNLINL